ncbi:hypothetical protein HYFRA_00007917, partial [Hymenoscyphus fraxineus]
LFPTASANVSEDQKTPATPPKTHNARLQSRPHYASLALDVLHTRFDRDASQEQYVFVTTLIELAYDLQDQIHKGSHKDKRWKEFMPTPEENAKHGDNKAGHLTIRNN